jgi:hypothetical protein
MATITKDIADAESRVRARAQFQRELIDESNRLLRENPTVPFRLGEENSDAVKTEISKRTGIPFSPPKKSAEKAPDNTQSEASRAATAETTTASKILPRDKPAGAAPPPAKTFKASEKSSLATPLQVGTCRDKPAGASPPAAQKAENTAHSHTSTAPSLRPAGQTILTEFEVIPDNEKVTLNEGTQQPRKMHAGPRMFNFGFSFNPAPAVSKAQKPKEK